MDPWGGAIPHNTIFIQKPLGWEQGMGQGAMKIEF